jgi:hypothetical protein
MLSVIGSSMWSMGLRRYLFEVGLRARVITAKWLIRSVGPIRACKTCPAIVFFSQVFLQLLKTSPMSAMMGSYEVSSLVLLCDTTHGLGLERGIDVTV